MYLTLFIKNNSRLLLLSLLVQLSSCETKKVGNEVQISTRDFGTLQDGTVIQLYTLSNKNGVEAQITNYGGIVTSLKVPDKNGIIEDVVLGFDDIKGYEGGHPYFGALIGRYGNRIAEGKFTLENTEYTLAVNNSQNHLHGGLKGFDKVLWKAVTATSEDGVVLSLSYTSEHMEEGYPGNLKVMVSYSLNNKNELAINYEATTDATTVVNLTNHSYFNLKGAGNGDILDHQLMIDAYAITPVDSGLIPTGQFLKVDNSPFDFQKAKTIGANIGDDDQQLAFGGGYDHNFVLNKKGNEIQLAARVTELVSGRVMEVLTTEPGIQFYSGNFLDGSNLGKGQKVYNFRYGFCLETQHFPDSPNQENFPTTVLKSA
jgi:aldose 1-epimerase